MAIVVLAVVRLAAQPKPSAAVIITRTKSTNWLGVTYTPVIKRTESIPSGSKIFDDEEEVLASITTASYPVGLCTLRLTSLDQ